VSAGRDIWDFLKVRKKFWLLPIELVLGMFGALLLATEGASVGQFVYTLF
jgi:hypothetical protein